MNPFASRSGAPSLEGDGESGAAQERLKCRLKSLHDGDAAVVEAVALGAASIPLLRGVLLESDAAGIFAPRQRAVQALAALGAHDVLREFVAAFEVADDPVRRMGDEAVLGTAARALGAVKDPRAFPVLLAAVAKHSAAGVIEALGEYRRLEVVSILAGALEDDLKRPAAQEAFEKLGQGALPALVETALRSATGPSGRETPSGILRRRRSALTLLLKLTVNTQAWEMLRRLTSEADEEAAILACRIGMTAAGEEEKPVYARKLVSLLPRAPWFCRQEIEDCLSANFTVAHRVVDDALHALGKENAYDSARLSLIRSLQRIKAKACTEHGGARLR